MGRAGRFGTKGLALTFVATEEDSEVQDVYMYIYIYISVCLYIFVCVPNMVCTFKWAFCEKGQLMFTTVDQALWLNTHGPKSVVKSMGQAIGGTPTIGWLTLNLLKMDPKSVVQNGKSLNFLPIPKWHDISFVLLNDIVWDCFG